MFTKYLSLAFAGFVLASCASATSVDPTDTVAIEQSMPSPSKARVYFYGAKMFWNPIEVFVNDIDVGPLNAGQAMAIDIPPGHYTFAQRIRNVWGGLNEPVSSTADLVAGQKVYIEAYIYTGPIFVPGGGGFVGGAIAGAAGYLANKASEPATPHTPGAYFEAMPQGADDVTSKTFVQPNPEGVDALNKAPAP